MRRCSAIARLLYVTGAGAAAICAMAGRATAQVPADASWSTIASAHFRVTFEPGLEPLARHAAASAERAHSALRMLVADAPDGAIDIVLSDNLDQSNGYATPFPSNRIVVYAKPPVDVLELQYTRDWVELVVTHELAHIFHLDVTSGFGTLLRTIFGRIPAPWPVFPAVGVPLWNVEGLAVGAESAVTGYGRVRGSYNEMIVRTSALARRLDEYDRLGSGSARWPGGSRVYIYGSLFMDYIARRYGSDTAARIVGATANAVIPPPLWFGRVGTDALGVTFREAYRDWEREVTARSDSIAAVLSARGLTTGTPLTTHRAIALHPRFSPDGSRIAYAAHDWRTPPALRVIDAVTGAEYWTERQNQPAAAAWLGADRLLTSEMDFVDRFRAFGDLHIVGTDDRQLTRGARLQEADVSRDGVIVAVQNANGTNRLVLMDTLGSDVRPLTDYDPGIHWTLPRFAPSGGRIAVVRWQTGGAYDIVVMDTLGAALTVTDGFGINGAPAWSADERWVLFSSDRTGIQNIHAADLAQITRDAAAGRTTRTSLRQVTNVLTGAFHPDVSPDGRYIAYAAYTHDGFVIERMPFDTAMWRSPAAAGLTRSIARRPEYMADRVVNVQDTPDTTTSAARSYDALQSLLPQFWFPVIDAGSVEDATFFGIWTHGRDIVERHIWEASLAVEPDGGRTQGWFGYTFRGLPTIPAIDMHPVVNLMVERDWDTYFDAAGPGAPHADERDDMAALTLGFTRARWRSTSGVGVGGERVRRSRVLYGAPPGTAFLDPHDDLWGLRANVFTARFVTPPLSISREDGYTVQIAGRERWEPENLTVETADGPVTFDASYREMTTWSTAYAALPFSGFARHVLAFRFSSLLRDGPGAPLSRLGGAGGSGFMVPGVGYDFGGASTLLPLRGVERGARIGSNAWTASLEYRFPVALIDTPWRPFFFDRISAAVFADAGHAWCGEELAARAAACASTSARAAPLLSAGAEITALIGFLGINSPIRFGAGVPLRYDDSAPRFYILTGPSF